MLRLKAEITCVFIVLPFFRCPVAFYSHIYYARYSVEQLHKEAVTDSHIQSQLPR